MSEWKEYLIEDFAEVKNTLRIPLSKLEREKRQGDFPYYGASGIIDYVDDFLFEGEHVLISEDGENLKSRKTPIAFKADGKFWVNNHAHILKGKRDEFNDLLVYYFANLNINEFITGAVQPKLSKSNLLSIPMFLPEDEETILEIVDFIKSLTDKIDLLHRQNQTLEQLAETLFREWFVEEADADWEEGTISDYAEHSKISIKPGANPLSIYAHFSIPGFDAGKEPVYEFGQEIRSNKYQVFANTILFSKLNPHKDKRVWLILDEVPENAICSTEFQVIKPYHENHLYFIYGWLSNSNNYREVSSGVGGTSASHQRISPNEIFLFPTPKVADEPLQDYAKSVKPLFLKQQKNQTQIRNLTALRDTLLPKLMSGEIRPSDNG